MGFMARDEEDDWEWDCLAKGENGAVAAVTLERDDDDDGVGDGMTHKPCAQWAEKDDVD